MEIKIKQEKSIALLGNLSVLTIENLMQLVGHAGLYGELQIKTPTNSATLFVQNGHLIYSYLEKNPVKIGQRLIQGNYITSEQLQDCLYLFRSEPSQPRLGRVLVEKGYIDQDDLEKVHKEQSKAAFFEVLSWKKGSFAFYVKAIPRNEDIFLQERIDHLTLAGVFQSDELNNLSNEGIHTSHSYSH